MLPLFSALIFNALLVSVDRVAELARRHVIERIGTQPHLPESQRFKIVEGYLFFRAVGLGPFAFGLIDLLNSSMASLMSVGVSSIRSATSSIVK
jgi:hypothetical protein